MSALDLSFDAQGFSGRAPLFPLPGLVHLPGCLLPLHVFEPRYRAMVEDALAGDRLIAMALLRPGYEADYEGNPAIEPWVCLGRIMGAQRLPDGRYTLVLVGLRRARVQAEDQSGPYRVGTLEVVEDDPLPADDEVRLGRDLADYLTRLSLRLVRDVERFQAALRLLAHGLPGPYPLGAALDIAADGLHLGLDERLRLLATPGPAARDALLRAILSERMDELGRLRGETPWPPGFSRN